MWNLWWHGYGYLCFGWKRKKLQGSRVCWRPELISNLLLPLSISALSMISDTLLCHIPFSPCFRGIYIWLVFHSWDILFFLVWKRRWLGNMFKSKVICPISLPLLLFSCSAAWRKLQYVLILQAFQEKYISECCFQFCHIMEGFLAAGRQPALPTKQLGHVHHHMGGEIACICLLHVKHRGNTFTLYDQFPVYFNR